MPAKRFYVIYIKTLSKALPCERHHCSKAPGRLLLLASLRLLRAVLGAGLHTTLNTLRIERTTDDVVTNAGKVLDTAAADQHDRVLLQAVADAGDVGRNLHAVGQTDSRKLTHSGVRLLRRHGGDLRAHASLLGRGLVGGSALQAVEALKKSVRLYRKPAVAYVSRCQ